jgi:hypothetical protein
MWLPSRPRRVLAVAAQTLATAAGFVIVVLALSDRRHVGELDQVGDREAHFRRRVRTRKEMVGNPSTNATTDCIL